MTKTEMEKRIEVLGSEISMKEDEIYELEEEIAQLELKIKAGEFDPAPEEPHG